MHWEKIGARSWLWRPAPEKFLAMVSGPSYDPNTIAQDWEALNADSTYSPLLNRVTQGAYAPGSTFKIVTALEYMREHPDYQNYSYNCEGSITYEDITIRCFDSTVHGLEDLRSSFANSCNSSFANIWSDAGSEFLPCAAEELLFNKKNCHPCWIIQKARL